MSNIFDNMAKQYDTPQRVEVATLIAQEIIKHNSLSPSATVLDYGCGTGLVGLALSPHFNQLIMADSSLPMLAVVEDKIKQQQLLNITTQQLKQPNELLQSVDGIVVSQTLLHIPQTLETLQQFYHLLNPSGQLIIVDFIKNDKVYHELIHNGFEIQQLSQQLVDSGFTIQDVHIFYEAPKLFMHQEAALFYLKAQKNSTWPSL